jgi:protein-tyrosine phosphatase
MERMDERRVDRKIAFEGIPNFRDYGGYAAVDGRLRTGRLYRSSQHRDATPEDLVKVHSLGLRVVIDLRGDSERREAPCPRPEGFSGRVLFVEDGAFGKALHVDAAKATTGPLEARAWMRANYADMLFRPNLLGILRRYFEILATEDGSTLVHCLAGKDRTGMAVALFHTLMGVHRDDIVAEYLLTNRADNLDALVRMEGGKVRDRLGRNISDATIRALMSVDPAYLDAAFSEITRRHGSPEGYLADQVGVTPEIRERIARLLIR